MVGRAVELAAWLASWLIVRLHSMHGAWLFVWLAGWLAGGLTIDHVVGEAVEADSIGFCRLGSILVRVA